MSTVKTEVTDSKATTSTAIKAPKEKAPKAEKVKKESDGKEHRGRKVNTESARQLRLKRFAEKIANGETVGRGRPKKQVDLNVTPKVKKEKMAKTEKLAPVKKAPSKKAEVKTEAATHVTAKAKK